MKRDIKYDFRSKIIKNHFLFLKENRLTKKKLREKKLKFQVRENEAGYIKLIMN